MKSKHPRLDELEATYGWTREILVQSEHGGGMHFQDWQARTTIDGRTVALGIHPHRRKGLSWDCGASWGERGRRRRYRQVKKRLFELIALTLDPAARRVMESVRDPSHARVEDGFQVGTWGLFYRAAGEPPPAGKVLEIVGTLAGMATKIETILDEST